MNVKLPSVTIAIGSLYSFQSENINSSLGYVEDNGYQLVKVIDLYILIFILALMFIRNLNVQISNNSPFCQTAVSCGFFIFSFVNFRYKQN